MLEHFGAAVPDLQSGDQGVRDARLLQQPTEELRSFEVPVLLAHGHPDAQLGFLDALQVLIELVLMLPLKCLQTSTTTWLYLTVKCHMWYK